MILLWFLLGVVLIFGIARYNESAKLFWTLLLSFIGAFTVTSVILNSNKDENESKTELVQMCPTQAQICEFVINNTQITDKILFATEVAPATVPVSQDYTFAPKKIPFTSCKDGIRILDKPPQLC